MSRRVSPREGRAYRWNGEGIAGVCNRFQNVGMTLALWDENDTILNERFFGLSGSEGNHGEDLKEYYFYLDDRPTHSYIKMLYKYPMRAFPYAELVETNRRRCKEQPEYELTDTGIFAENRYFDVFIEYAKADEFYASIQNSRQSHDENLVQRQAFAGRLWSQKFDHYSVELWLKGDPHWRTLYLSTNISTETTARALEPAIRPAGRPWWPD